MIGQDDLMPVEEDGTSAGNRTPRAGPPPLPAVLLAQRRGATSPPSAGPRAGARARWALVGAGGAVLVACALSLGLVLRPRPRPGPQPLAVAAHAAPLEDRKPATPPEQDTIEQPRPTKSTPVPRKERKRSRPPGYGNTSDPKWQPHYRRMLDLQRADMDYRRPAGIRAFADWGEGLLPQPLPLDSKPPLECICGVGWGSENLIARAYRVGIRQPDGKPLGPREIDQMADRLNVLARRAKRSLVASADCEKLDAHARARWERRDP